MMKGRAIASALAVVVMVACAGCGGGETGEAPAAEDAGMVSLRVVLGTGVAQVAPSAAVADIAEVTVGVTGPEMKEMTASLELHPAAGEATGTLEVPQGIDRTFEVEALDADGNALFAGENVADIEAGRTTSVTVHLWPVSAEVGMQIGIENPAPGLGVLQGLCYSPFRPGQSPHTGVYPSEDEVIDDMTLLADRVERIRLYSSTHIHRQIPRLAVAAGIECWAQAWLDADAPSNEDELQALIAIGQEGNAPVLIVGSEVLLREDMPPADLIAAIERVRAAVPDVPVTCNDTVQELIDHPEVVAACDFVFCNSYPFWEGVPAPDAVEHVAADYDRISAAFPDQRIVIGETGWPSGGSDNAAAVSDPVNQRRFLTGFVEWCRSREVEYFFFEATDEDWKVRDEGSVGDDWGLFETDRTMKTEIRRVWY
jgi:exo-beta-1,3-glucanase (GH17 family)